MTSSHVLDQVSALRLNAVMHSQSAASRRSLSIHLLHEAARFLNIRCGGIGGWVKTRDSTPSGAAAPGGPQSLAGPTALLDSAGRSGLLRFATARPPLEAASGLDSGDGRSSQRSIVTFNRRDFEPAASRFGIAVLAPGEVLYRS